MAIDAYHLDEKIIRADDGSWCYPANLIEIDLFAEVDRLRAALKPFADCVYNDNGNLTYTSHATTSDYLRAYKALQSG